MIFKVIYILFEKYIAERCRFGLKEHQSTVGFLANA
jgi:hypothetical protein